MKKIILVLSILLVSISSFGQEDFELSATALPSGWNQYQNSFGLAQFWKISSLNTSPPAVCQGLNAAFIDRENIGIGNTSEDYLVSPQQIIPANGQVKFLSRQGFTGEQGTLYRLMISTNAVPSILSSYVLLKQWTETEMNTDFNICQEQVFDIPASYTGQNVYLAFVKVVTQPTTAIAGDRWFLDHIGVYSKCLAPTLGTATNIAATSATLSWTMPAGSTATSWDIEIYTGAPTGTPTYTGVQNSFNVTGLTPNTAYQFCVRSNCSATNQSAWVCGFNIQTTPLGAVCNGSIPITTLPYTHSENTGNIGNYYNTQQAGACGAIPTTTNYVAGNDVFYSYTPTFSGPISIKMTPTGPNSSVFVFSGCPTLGNCLAGVANTNSSIRIINPFVVTAGTTYYILVSSSATTPTIGYTLVIQREPCNPPVGLPVTNITTTSADLSWTNPTSATNWEYVVQPLATSSIPTGTGTPVISNTNVTAPLLNPATQYVYWVRSDCGGGLFSSWNGPYPFNTLICNNVDKCTYNFRLAVSTGAGWNGARMDVRQNGIVVATIGSTFTTGLGPVDVTVQLCKNVPFDLFWTTAGTQPARCIVAILNSFGQTLYTKPAGTSGVGQVVYGNTVNCDTPVCTIPPINIVASNITTTTADIAWASPGTAAFGYDIYVIPTGSTAPTASTIPTYANVTTNPFTISNLLHDTSYCVYVRVVCSLNSDWASFCSFTTLPSCFKPTSPVITAGSITATSATFTWVNGTPTDTQWEFLLIPSQTAPLPAPDFNTTATTYPGSIFASGATVTSPFTPTLTPMTIYYAYVRTVCSGTDWSSWTPYAVFNTICGGTSCNYKFFPTSTVGSTWNGGRMQVKQNGIVIATIGAASINAAAGVSVSLCTGVPYELYWSVAGTTPDNIGLTIQNPFLDVIYTKAPATGTPLTVLFSDIANCTPAPCSKPTLMTAVPSATSAVLTWTDNSLPASTSFDLYIVPTGGPAPINVPPSAPTISGVTNPYTLTTLNGLPLTPSTSYTYYVRANCGGTDHSAWTVLTPITFITTPLNDECLNATPVTVNTGITCVAANTLHATTYGATASLPILTPALTGAGCGQTNKDVWFSFVAGATSQTINLSNIVGTPAATTINHSVFSGTCTNLTKLYCSTALTSIATGLTVGQTYYIRVYTPSATAVQSATFDLCITSPPANDECLNAINVPVNTGQNCVAANNVHGNTFGATTSLPAVTGTGCGTSDDDVWYSFVATATSQTININSIVGTPTTVTLNHTVFSGVCGTLTKLYCSTSTSSGATGLTVGATYYIRVYTSGSTVGQSAEFDMCITSPPANDECTGAVNVPVNPNQVCTQSVAGNTLGGTPSIPTALTGTGCGTSDDDVWYSFVATNNIHIIDLSGVVPSPSTATITLNHTVFSGTCPGALVKKYCSTTAQSVATGLVIGQTYYIRVYTAGSTAGQSATFNICIQTPPAITNDECFTAIQAQVNNDLDCVLVTPALLTGATASTASTTCIGTEDDDVWFQFTANATTQYFSLLNVIGMTTDLNHAVYSGVCGALVQKYCSAAGSLTSNNATFVIGQTYYVRVWSNSSIPQNVSFSLCIGKIPPPILANTTQYTHQQLIEDVLLNTTCAQVTNITSSTGTDFGSTNGIGYFNQGLSGFPFQDGIVLSTGNAASSPGPNLTTLSDGTAAWTGDTDLEAIVLAGTGTAMVSHNATKLEFDFVPLTNHISFNFIFASEEYGTFQCSYSDAFAFILTNTVTGATSNLAIIPSTTTPVSVVTIRDQLYNTGCASANPAYFGTFYGTNGIDPQGAPINFNGKTIPMTASSTVTPNISYHIKLVIADRGDNAFDSAVFLEGGSFDIGNVELGGDFLQSAGNAICVGDTATLNSGLDPTLYTISWYRDNVLIPGENGVNLQVTLPGVYSIHAQYGTSTCFATDTITVEYFVDTPAGTPINLVDCNASGVGLFNLNQNTTAILSPYSANHNVVYFTTLADATNNVNAILNPSAFVNTTNPQTIYVRVNNTVTHCKQLLSFVLNVQDLTPQFTLTGNTTICSNSATTIAVLPTNNNFDTSLVSYIWTYNGNVITGQIASSLLINGSTAGGVYTVTVNNNGCTAVQSFTITVTPFPKSDFSYSSAVYCKNSSISNPTPIYVIGAIAGTFTYTTTTPGAILVINPTTGEIDLANSSVGNYVITNTIAASSVCADSPSLPVLVNIIDLAVGTFHYPQLQYCSNGVNPTPVLDGISGQFSSIPNTLVINATTGVVDLATSPAGTYTVHNIIAPAGGCAQVDATTQFTITALPNATFNYSGVLYCKNSGIADPAATVTVAGGSFTYTTTTLGALLVMNSSGTIDLAASSVGVYTITYTIAAANGCPDSYTSVTVEIKDLPIGTFHYAQLQYCNSGTTDIPLFDGVHGTLSSVPSGVIFNADGSIDLVTSPAGSYTIHNYIPAANGCSDVDAIQQITISNQLVSNFSYSSPVYCKDSLTANPLPIPATGGISGTYTYTATPTTAILDINPTTGLITINSSMAGVYIISNTIAAGNGCQQSISTPVTVEIKNLPIGTFHYAQLQYCNSGTTDIPLFDGVHGTLSSVPAGIIFNADGSIDLATSSPGIYTIHNIIAPTGGCAQVDATTQLTITALPNATFNYSAAVYCKNSGIADPAATVIVAGGSFTYTTTTLGAILIMNSSGTIDLAASSVGDYTITYTIVAANGCPDSYTSVNISIIDVSVATFHYPQLQYCSNGVNPTPVLDGISGQFSSVPNTLVINATTGVVDLATSPAGTYTVHNIIAAAGGCAQVDETTQITITTLPVAGFSYDATAYCKNATNPVLTYVPNGVAGLFSYTATPTGALLDINPTTGAVNLATSAAGTYSIINTIAAANGCGNVISSAVSITLTAPPVADFSYTNTIYCKVTGTTPPVFTGGGVAGTFTATPSGLVINPTTGVVDLGNSAAGTYQVTNTIGASGGCAQVQNALPVTITITAPPTGTISYTSVMCQSSTGLQNVTNTAPAGGTYASTLGLNLNPTTGAINPSASTAGVYSVTYSLPASAGCSVFTTLPVQVTIIEQSVIDFQSGCDATIYKLVAVPGTFNPIGATYNWTGPTFSSFSVLPNMPNAIKVNTIGQYVVNVTTADGCTATESFDVTSVTCEIQKGISPNGDGNNDYFDLTALNVKKIEIFNRYGTSVYSLDNYTTQWHGQANGGLALPDGTYFYMIEKADGVTITGWVYINK